jgi:hypothetical protein
VSRAKNEPIGEVDCPHRGCTSKSKVFKFQARAGDATRTRFAGKVYCDCPVHGRYGADGKQAAQEYILENATIWNKAPAANGHAPATAPVPAPALAAPLAPPPHWSDRFQTLIKL